MTTVIDPRFPPLFNHSVTTLCHSIGPSGPYPISLVLEYGGKKIRHRYIIIFFVISSLDF